MHYAVSCGTLDPTTSMPKLPMTYRALVCR